MMSYRQLMAAERGRISLLQGLGPQWVFQSQGINSKGTYTGATSNGPNRLYLHIHKVCSNNSKERVMNLRGNWEDMGKEREMDII